MLKEKIFKFLFPEKAETIEMLEEDIMEVFSEMELAKTQFAFGFDFSEVDDFGKPKHYLDGLSETERGNYIAELESIYNNKRFKEVINYCINLIGNKTIQVVEEKDMFKGRYMILGTKKVLEEFENAHAEFINSKKSDESFDKLATLPE